MQGTTTLAIIPKARGMYARRLSGAEYEELMRRRTVPELAALLKRHPYFKDSLATLSTIDPHREQIEELLNMDIFNKYEALTRYDFSSGDFSAWYLTEVELREILRVLQLLSVGLPEAYAALVPAYLASKTRIDLFALADARDFGQVVELAKGTPCYKILRDRWRADPTLHDFPMTEAAMLRFAYAGVMNRIDKTLHGREAALVRGLFLQEIETYNLELLLRVKTYFSTVYTLEQLEQLLMPYHFRVPKQRLQSMARAASPEALMTLIHATPGLGVDGEPAPDMLMRTTSRMMYCNARRVLHLTASPMAALVAFVRLAGLERENVVNVVEGVRYSLTPEEIRPMLRS